MKHIVVDRAENGKCCGGIAQKMKILVCIVQKIKLLLFIAEKIKKIVVNRAENETY